MKLLYAEDEKSMSEFPGGESVADSAEPPQMPDGTEQNSGTTDFSRENNQFNEQSRDNAHRFMPENSKESGSTGTDSNALSKENIIYVLISFAVLILGCIVAFQFKKRF